MRESGLLSRTEVRGIWTDEESKPLLMGGPSEDAVGKPWGMHVLKIWAARAVYRELVNTMGSYRIAQL